MRRTVRLYAACRCIADFLSCRLGTRRLQRQVLWHYLFERSINEAVRILGGISCLRSLIIFIGGLLGTTFRELCPQALATSPRSSLCAWGVPRFLAC